MNAIIFKIGFAVGGFHNFSSL